MLVGSLNNLLDFVAGAEVAGLKLAEFAAYELSPYLGDAVDEHVAVQMVKLVLHHAAAEAVEGLGYGFSLLVDVLDGDSLRAGYGAVDVRNAQAAF